MATAAELVARPVRTIRNAGELPKEFVLALQGMPFRTLPGKHGSVERHAAEAENGVATVRLECRLADVVAGRACG